MLIDTTRAQPGYNVIEEEDPDDWNIQMWLREKVKTTPSLVRALARSCDDPDLIRAFGRSCEEALRRVGKEESPPRLCEL